MNWLLAFSKGLITPKDSFATCWEGKRCSYDIYCRWDQNKRIVEKATHKETSLIRLMRSFKKCQGWLNCDPTLIRKKANVDVFLIKCPWLHDSHDPVVIGWVRPTPGPHVVLNLRLNYKLNNHLPSTASMILGSLPYKYWIEYSGTLRHS